MCSFVWRCRGSWRRPRQPVVARTSTDDNDNSHIEVVFKQKSAAIYMTSFPVELGSRPPCLGQECSPIRSTPCGAGRETGSSAATAGTTSGGTWRQVVPPGRVDLGRVAALRRRRRRRSTPLRERPDVPSPAVVQHSYRKVDTWLRHHAAPEVENNDVTHQPTAENQLKRKLLRGEIDSAAKRRVTDSDSCSLPSGTFTSDDEEDEVDDKEDSRVDCTATKCPSADQRSVLPAAPVSPSFQKSAAHRRMAKTSPRWKKRSPLADAVYSRRRRTGRYRGDETADLSSGVLGDRSSSLATSGELAPCQPSTVCRTPTAAKTTATSRKNAVDRRRKVLRRVTRMARRLHRVAAADALSDIHVQTLAVL